MNDIRKLLEAYGDAVFRSVNDYTEATAPALQENATKAFGAVIDFHGSAVQHAREASDRKGIETVKQLRTANATIERMEKVTKQQAEELKAKVKEEKAKDAISEDYRSRCQAAVAGQQAAETELKRKEVAEQARKKAAWESHQASKKARL
jgi:hypothetical protein